MEAEATESKIDTKDLQKIIKLLKDNKSFIKVGIMGNGAARSGSKMSNAEVGAIYEFDNGQTKAGGSFLRVPISEQLQKRLDDAGALDPAVVKSVIKQGTFTIWLGKIAVMCESIVQEAFDTSGFGKWKKSNMTFKQIKQTLVETQQLRNSITSEVSE